ncbi:MAG: sensor histidine kinase, partial [Stellaceae bacterium]
YEPVADESGLQLLAEIGASLPVRGDRHLLSQAIANLLDNALKYTPEGDVRLAVRRGDAGHIVIEVADSGPGVPAAHREHVFDRFFRLENSRSTPGNGLGLSLVRAVATLHGGEVRLADNDPGLKAMMILPTAPERAASLSNRTAA